VHTDPVLYARSADKILNS